MPLPPLVLYQDEAQYRAHFETKYCNGPVVTFDGIGVRFRKTDFDHAFYESSNRDKNKDSFSAARAERIDWIEATLQDPNSELYQGWDKKKRRYDKIRRVALINGNYVVIIRITGHSAEFVTAFVGDTAPTPARPLTTIDLIRRGPKWA